MIYPKHGPMTTDLNTGRFRGEPVGSSPCLVDIKGYIPMKTQIRRLDDAGKRLLAYRRMTYGVKAGEYDSEDPNFDGEPSPLLDPDFMPSTDMARVAEGLKAKLSTSFSGFSSDDERRPEKSQSESKTGENPEKTGVSGEPQNPSA